MHLLSKYKSLSETITKDDPKFDFSEKGNAIDIVPRIFHCFHTKSINHKYLTIILFKYQIIYFIYLVLKLKSLIVTGDYNLCIVVNMLYMFV